MSIFKCKMCGGTLEINENETVATCEYCGTQQTLPKLDDDRRANLYDRANHFRRSNEFDKAMGIYEQILAEDNTDAEAYWSLVLCRYGIEYVEDPSSHKRIPTVNRAQFTSIFDDDNYKAALRYADGLQRTIYEKEAKAINEIQKGILAISQKEEPFDVFICYKETDNSGRRTQDSVLAQDLYYQLTQEGFKVFFSRITLEDKLGSAYEPYIFAALNSAKVMVVLGTKPEYFNAIWVKNEWSRYLALIKSGQKKMLIPAYKNMDPYDLPQEFSHLQAQDMSKLGFMQDLIRGIKKIAQADAPKTTVIKETIVSAGNANTAPLLKRAHIFLEDGDWESADEYAEKVLDIDPECAEAYVVKLMAELRVQQKTRLEFCNRPFDHMDNYNKVLRFGSNELIKELKKYNVTIRESNEENRKASIYNDGVALANCQTPQKQIEAAIKFEQIVGYKNAEEMAKNCRRQALKLSYDIATEVMNNAATAQQYTEAGRMFLEISDDYEAAKEKATECAAKAGELAEIERNDAIYVRALEAMEEDDISSIERAVKNFQTIIEWRDSESKIKECNQKIADIKEQQEQKRIAAEKAAKKRKKITAIAASCICVTVAFMFVLNFAIIPADRYSKAMNAIERQDYATAYELLQKLGDYKDSGYQKNVVKVKQEKAVLKNAKVGDYVFFGSYEQDNNTSNGKEDIEWLVLEVENGKALVISKYALDCKRYNTSYTSVTWETCTLRTWLNNDFISSAFLADEKAMIPTVTVSADRNPNYSTNPGNATQDKVFLLSITEVNKYFSSDAKRQCECTAYADANGAYVASNGNCWWWLRSPGYTQVSAAFVYNYGDVLEDGDRVRNADFAVRPALWIDLNS